MPKTPFDPCKKSACKIQTCLRENNYQEAACAEILEQMRLCCVKWHSESLCCSGFDLNKSYLPSKKPASK